MKLVSCLIAAGLYLCLQSFVQAELRLSRSVIENAVSEAKATVDAAYTYSRKESIERVKRNAMNPSDILRLLKQPVGPSRDAVRAADYMDVTMTLLRKSLGRRQRRSINATDLLTEEEIECIANLTGCSPQHRMPSCKTTCSVDTYRTASSTCNNKKNTRWGSGNTPFTRWLPAQYQDKISRPKGWNPRRRLNRNLLPLVREVSNNVLHTKNSIDTDPLYTHLLTIFGQFTDHDVTFTPHSPVIRSFSNGIDCETSCERTEPCFPIEIPRNDPRIGRNSHECMPFFRSAPACGSGTSGENFGASTVRQQINTLTAFIDGGQMYGSDEAKARYLRNLTSDDGSLRANELYFDNGRELLPFTTMGVNMCATRANITKNPSAEEVPCFVAGDERANENIALTSLHTLFMREHNRLVRALAKLNPNWGSERLYQEARKILGAFLQVITYRDYLPFFLGKNVFDKDISDYTGYNENVNPTVSNVFATAAYRFSHMMIQPFMFRLDEDYRGHSQYPTTLLHRSFFTPWRIIFEGGLDPVVRGLIGRRAKLNTQEHMMHDELRERLFKFSSELALDLASLNMQRGRDHGLPGYSAWRKFCGLSVPRNRRQLTRVLGNRTLATILLDHYGTPKNIDVWLGGVAEPLVPGGRVGPLFSCLIARQFKVIRDGDRFWWENKGVFTADQRKSLKNVSLSRIICDNTGITEVPANPFLFQFKSKFIRCDNKGDIPVVDLSPWKESLH